MCGIAGIIHFDGTPVDPVVLDKLTDALAHRGPDGRGTWAEDGVGFGHRRLKILDLSAAAHQPMVAEDKSVVLTFNGEIYNYRELRSKLESRGYRFTSTGDTEVLLKLYQEFGEVAFAMLRGMFAFGIFDRKREQVLLVRDRVGKKPLKYFISGNTFAFASELKALRQLPQCPSGIDQEAIHHYLTMMYLPSPRTGITGIEKLPAAHVLTIDLKTKKHSIKQYWSLSYKSDHSVPLPEWERRVKDVFEDSVRLRMVADVPVGAFLSGGIDSAAVVATMAKLSDRPVETFSIGTKTQSHNELPFAELVAERFSTHHHPIVVEPDIVHLLPELVRSYEEPYADPSAIPTFLIARETKQFVTVALNGDGGDENFAGYVRYPILRFSEKWARLPSPLHALVRLLVRGAHGIFDSTLTYRMLRFQSSISQPWPERFLQYLSFFTEEEKRSLYKIGFGDSFPRTDQWYANQTEPARARSDTLIHQALSMDLNTYLADDLLPKVDLGSMASGLEARSPFLDHVLLELTATMPDYYKLHGRSKKWFLKHLLKGVIPDQILTKPKTGFRLPLDRWFRTDLSSFVSDRLLSSSSPLWAMFDRAAMERFLKFYHQSRVDMSDHVWALLWLDEWMRQVGSPRR